jgi:hypothetical protein
VIDEALAAAALTLGADAGRALARLGGPLGEAARARLAELEALGDAAARRARRAGWMATARIAVPPGLRQVDPSWLEAAVAGDLAARAAVAASGGGPAEVWRARWATAGLAPMPASPDGSGAADPAPLRGTLDLAVLVLPADAITAPPSRLTGWLATCGAEQLAAALAPADLAAVADRSPDGARLRAAAERRAAPGGAREAGPRRTLLQRAAGLVLAEPTALVQLGARAVGPHLDGDELTRWRLALRLPRPLGLVVAAGLGRDEPATARTPWATLAAAW